MNVYADGSSRPAGKVVTLDGQTGLAIIRLEAAFGPKQSPLRVGQKSGPVISAHQPSWWPEQWGREQ